MWRTQVKLCTATLTGGGCGPDEICVERAATKTCATANGATTCGTGYTPERGGTWYTGATDDRSCGLSCNYAGTYGDPNACAQARLQIFTTNDCSGPGTSPSTSPCTVPGVQYFPTASVVGAPSGSAQCTLMNTMSGSATPTGPRTLCCR